MAVSGTTPHKAFIDQLQNQNGKNPNCVGADGAGPNRFKPNLLNPIHQEVKEPVKKEEKEPVIMMDGASKHLRDKPQPIVTDETKKDTIVKENNNIIMMDGASKHLREKQDLIKKNTLNISEALFAEIEQTPADVANELIFETNQTRQMALLISFQSKVEKMSCEEKAELKCHLDSLKNSFPGENKSGSLNKNELVNLMLGTVNRELSKARAAQPAIPAN